MRLITKAKKFILTIGFVAVCAGTGGVAWAQSDMVFESQAGPVAAEVVAEGLAFPWAIGFLPDGRLLVTERPGRLRVIDADGQPGAPITGVPEVWAEGQGGLLDVALAPDFATSGRLYLSYAQPGLGGAGTAVMAATLTLLEDSGALSDQKVIFRMNRFTGRGQHFGSRIVVAPDGNLWVTLGERGERDRAQDPFDLAGAVVRIAPDGSIPADNPFADGGSGNAAIWSLGHRNPQGAALGPDGALWTVEHGAAGGDEINRPEAGLNYGWPVITYGRDYNGQPIGEGTEKAGYQQPVHYWDPSIAPSGLDFYAGELFPDWQGDLLVGSLKFGLLVRLDMADGRVVDEERLLDGAFGRIRDVRTGPDGAIYLATDERDGRIIRLTPAQ